MFAKDLSKQTKDAIDLERPLDVTRVGDEKFKLKSSNDTYYVDLSEDSPCTCPGQHFHNKCRHTERVKILLGQKILPRKYKNKYTDLDRDDYPTDDVRYE